MVFGFWMFATTYTTVKLLFEGGRVEKVAPNYSFHTGIFLGEELACFMPTHVLCSQTASWFKEIFKRRWGKIRPTQKYLPSIKEFQP